MAKLKKLGEPFVLVDTILDQRIYFNKKQGTFYWQRGEGADGEHSREYLDLVRMIEKDHETRYEGQFYVYDSWDGIVPFQAKRRYYDRFEGVYRISGIADKAGNSNKTYLEDELFPVNEHNTALLEKQRRLKSQGWQLIRQADAVGKDLTKEPGNYA